MFFLVGLQILNKILADIKKYVLICPFVTNNGCSDVLIDYEIFTTAL